MSEQDSLSRCLDRGHARWSDWTGSFDGDQFAAKTARLAELFAVRFPEQRSRIGMWGGNSLDYIAVIFAILRAGHVAVPLNIRLTARELSGLVDAVDIAGLLISSDYPPSHQSLLASLPTINLSERLDPESSAGKSNVKESSEDETAVLMCSSGSSGRPKIIPLTLRSLFDHASAVCSHLAVTPRDCWLICLPFYHVGGLTIPFRCLLSGASLTISRSADPDEINRLIDSGEVTLVSMVPTVLDRLLTQRRSDFPESLRAIIVGGGPVSDSLLARCPKAFATYGMTEAGSMLTCARPGCMPEERMTAGLPLPGTTIRILADDGTECPAGETGQIVARGPGMTQTYLGDPEAATSTFHDGWIHTGDLGFLDCNGFLHVQARRTDMVISGGENIYPAEIEKALLEHSRIVEAIVVPIEDSTWGQTAGALIVLKPGPPLNPKDIYLHLEDRLARHKFPRVIAFAESIPLLANGKPDPAKIRTMITQAKKE